MTSYSPFQQAPRRKNPRRSLEILVGIVGVLAAIAWYGSWLSSPDKNKGADFHVATGENTATIVDNLKKEKVIRSELLFKMALKKSGQAAKLQPGIYNLEGAEDFEQLIKKLTTGGVTAAEHTLLIKEGWNLGDIKDMLVPLGYSDVDIFQVTGFPAVDARTFSSSSAPWADDFSEEFPFLKDKPPHVSLEGFLFPDTYRVFKDATPTEIVHKMLSNFDAKLTPDMRAKIAASNRTVFEVVTLASIIEREVIGDEDRRKVADLFLRRLEAGMPLQADSTVNYVTGKNHAAVGLEDTKNESPFNTYKYKGLPLGPISNPGLSSLQAAINPLPNDFVYFLTDPEGNVHYARTFDEHVANKFKYLK